MREHADAPVGINSSIEGKQRAHHYSHASQAQLGHQGALPDSLRVLHVLMAARPPTMLGRDPRGREGPMQCPHGSLARQRASGKKTVYSNRESMHKPSTQSVRTPPFKIKPLC